MLGCARAKGEITMYMKEFFQQLGIGDLIPEEHPINKKFLVLIDSEDEEDSPLVEEVSQVSNCVYLRF